ncbi:MAG: hypothetical protein KGH53_00820 [Candidatus Micrarchaeota archaeon]|nr:hypothetical protein [Candidatus Micrarchaeota archaeon]
MQAQSSLEFLLVLCIVSALALGMVSYYHSIIPSKSSLMNLVSPQSYSNLTNIEINSTVLPRVLLYVPSNSTVNSSNLLQVASLGCQNGSITLSFSSPGTLFSRNRTSFALNGTSFGSIYFTPTSTGYTQILTNYTYLCGSRKISNLSTLSTFSSRPLPAPSISTPYVLITNRVELLSYNLTSNGPILNLNTFNHCTYSGPFGVVGIGGECGTSNAWEYSVFSNYCYTQGHYYTITYCVIPSPMNSTLSSLNPSNPLLSYSFNLSLSLSGKILNSKVVLNKSSPLYQNGKQVGTVKVTNASSASSPPNLNLLTVNGSSTQLDLSLYQSYLQARNNLFGSLSFYNKSEVSPDIQSSLESSISSYVKVSGNLLNAPANSPPCKLSASKYVCDSPSPFYYSIIVNITGPHSITQNFTYQGSTIKVLS